MLILGIETSCDETSAAVVEDGKRLLSCVVASSMDIHAKYGGVVPEVAARSHIEAIIPVIEKALEEAFSQDNRSSKIDVSNNKSKSASYRLPASNFDPWDQIDGIAVTYGAGLGGSLLIGVLTARTLAITKNKPLYAVNHVEAHVYANFLTESANSSQLTADSYRLPKKQPEFPMLALIVSGNHTQLALFKNHFDYRLLGQTHDDAIGEAFDKVARIIGLPYPGGPSIAKAALKGNPKAFKFPKANMEDAYSFSFSGPKTAVLRTVQRLCGKSYDFPSFKLSELLKSSQKADIAASFQFTAVQTVVDKTLKAFEEFKPKSVVIAGGVAANQELRHQLTERLPRLSGQQNGQALPVQYPDIKLCTDNGAMVATLGCYVADRGRRKANPYLLETKPSLSM